LLAKIVLCSTLCSSLVFQTKIIAETKPIGNDCTCTVADLENYGEGEYKKIEIGNWKFCGDILVTFFSEVIVMTSLK